MSYLFHARTVALSLSAIRFRLINRKTLTLDGSYPFFLSGIALLGR